MHDRVEWHARTPWINLFAILSFHFPPFQHFVRSKKKEKGNHTRLSYVPIFLVFYLLHKEEKEIDFLSEFRLIALSKI